ncbi:MAG: NYN domain-containing protein [Alphaproteobacteria bacterium]|nr:NYN domain-containing protein [Alphaproteobacteria bacterium]
MKKRVIAYIDGFNLFYSSLKGTPYKWLDLVKLCESMLKPDDELVAVKYFTAKIKSNKNEPERSLRQDIYLEALATNPKIQIKYGYFSIHKTKMPLAADWENGKINTIEVIKTEEKGTDVNLAVQMVADAKDDLFDKALLFSNDSDMAYAVQIAAQDCGKFIGLFIDKRAISFPILKSSVHYIRRLTPTVLAAAQFPDEIITSTGRTIRKPQAW